MSARELWRGAAGLLRTSGAKVFAAALPFGMSSLWLEQSILGLYPRAIKDQRGAAIIAFYGSMAIAYLGYATISACVLPRPAHLHQARGVSPRFVWRPLVSALTIALIAPLATIAGLAVAVVPGVVVWLSWVLAEPMVATHRLAPFEALRQSAGLTWGSRWSLFHVFATVQLAVLVMSALVAAALGQPIWAPLEDPKPLSALEAIIGGLVEVLQLGVSGALCCTALSRLDTAQAETSMIESG